MNWTNENRERQSKGKMEGEQNEGKKPRGGELGMRVVGGEGGGQEGGCECCHSNLFVIGADDQSFSKLRLTR